MELIKKHNKTPSKITGKNQKLVLSDGKSIPMQAEMAQSQISYNNNNNMLFNLLPVSK